MFEKLKLIPPTGHKIFFNDIFKKSKEEILADNYYWFNSGTSALYFLLYAMNIPLNSSIIIPAYSCPQVATAVLKAGHKPVLCDISLETLAYESDLLIKRINEVDAKAVVVVNLFGLNDKIPDLDIPVIVDNAQQYPFVVNKNITAEIYSFGRGKPLNSLSGGVAIINNYNSFENVKEKYESVHEDGLLSDLKYFTKILLYKLFSIPVFYKIIYSLPFLHLGETIFENDFTAYKIISLNKKVINSIYNKKLEYIKEKRKYINIKYENILTEYNSDLSFFKNKEFYRFPVLCKKPGVRDDLVDKFQKSGIGAFPLYPIPLNKQPGLDKILNDRTNYKNAEFISENLFTLPVNEFVKHKDIMKVKSILDLVFKSNIN